MPEPKTMPYGNPLGNVQESWPSRAAHWLRSLLFNVLFFGWTGILFGLVFWWLLLLPRRYMLRAVRFWSLSLLTLLRWTLGISHEIRGREHLPPGPCLLASRHQSAWDTLFFFELFADPAFIVKETLMRSPFYDWYAHKAGMIPAYRGGRELIHKLLGAVQAALDGGRTVIIFPEGKRVGVGEQHHLMPGVALIHDRIKVPILPVVLNSGLYWGRRSFMKRPGRILVEILPALAPELRGRKFLTVLETQIEEGSARLEQEAAAAIAARTKPNPV
jgi:1-acyl-sn-glycerol-3-phosphate acyltransferase